MTSLADSLAGKAKPDAEPSAYISDIEALEEFAASLSPPDQSQWAAGRVRDYEKAKHEPGSPVAVLTVPSLKLEVPVFDRDDDLSLNRGAGLVAGMGTPDQGGNVGIAGHRDGFFRGLKDIAPGDTIDLVLPSRTSHYVVENILITSPDDVTILRPTPKSSLTLVTCYPFYFVGSAPQRYIVSASAGFEPSEFQPRTKLAVPQLAQRRD